MYSKLIFVALWIQFTICIIAENATAKKTLDPRIIHTQENITKIKTSDPKIVGGFEVQNLENFSYQVRTDWYLLNKYIGTSFLQKQKKINRFL